MSIAIEFNLVQKMVEAPMCFIKLGTLKLQQILPWLSACAYMSAKDAMVDQFGLNFVLWVMTKDF